LVAKLWSIEVPASLDKVVPNGKKNPWRARPIASVVLGESIRLPSNLAVIVN
jgi:hypothetical protein